ncbi:hypothetical protein ACFFLS_12260 [Flavobacterium procerum]|uniref:Uncharacterized protein n=1 Tax=Flavobacterium procerum TaxID=1455569 RepID=A0ABV6BQU6_9FLAO
MRTRKIYNFDEFLKLDEKKKAIKIKMNETKKEREKKQKESKELTAEIRTLKRQLKSLEKKTGK